MNEAALNWQSLGLDGDTLAHRRSLIEASAGTGKTWTISTLYLRLVTERGWRASQVVVTTFTDAAAQELRERIRTRLTWALTLTAATQLIETPDDDPGVRDWLAQRWQGEPGSQAQDALRLRLALSELDSAPIGTIHGLCRKILSDQPFASASPFRIGEMTADEDLVRELVDDLIRVCAHTNGDGLAQRAAVSAMLDADQNQRRDIEQVVKLVLSAANVVIGPDLDAFDAALSALEPHRTALAALAARTDWRKSVGTGQLEQYLLSLAGASDDLLALRDAISGFEAIAKAPTSYVVAKFKNEFEQNPAFLAAKALAQQFIALGKCLHVLPALMHGEKLRTWRQQRLTERNQFTFDELIERVHQGTVASSSARMLADRLFAMWPVALIDEFQDTDARQFGIFNAIYTDVNDAPRGQLIMIGDPKQAIYSFRGGDIDAYLGAAKRATQRMSLTKNFRSSARVISALNELYAAATCPFGMENNGIAYAEVTPSGKADEKPLVTSMSLGGGGLLFGVLTASDDDNEQIVREEDRALAACADQIMAYLQPGAATIGDEPVQPKHFAILLPKRKYIGVMRDLLTQRGIPCVGSGNDSIFETLWARELRVVLYALLQVTDAGALRAAMATRLFGRTLLEIEALDGDLREWKREVERFAGWASAWREQGVLHAINQLIEMAAPRLLAQLDGERAMTDLRHLGELLQARSQETPGREQLLVWLADQCDGGSGGNERSGKERELRIESDEKRVQIMTLHASKGLEFDIVMLPLMWKHDVIRTAPKFGARSSASDSMRIVDLGSPEFEAHVERLALEQHQERLRVLYVALTRARHACHVILSAKLASRRGDDSGAKAAAPKCNDSGIAHFLYGIALTTLAQKSEWIHVGPVLPASGNDALAVVVANADRVARRFERWLPFVGSHSFSTLTRQRKAIGVDDGGAANDENETHPAAEDTTSNRDSTVHRDRHAAIQSLSDVRGAKFGNAMHAVFEHREHGRPLSQQVAFVSVQLLNEGVRAGDGRADLVPTLAARVDAALAADLGGGMRLNDVAADAQRAEMAFTIQLSVLQLQAFERVCRRHGYPDLLPSVLHRSELRGFLTGKIDLVFEHGGRVHVLDYKSNWLGDSVTHYLGDSLVAAMHEHAYAFQALLYVIAVDRYLRQRKPDYQRERDLGDVIYLFVRAAGLADGAGIWRHRFPSALIVELDALFEVNLEATA
ncbi:MAG: UvrD-helicase domain-containing protein [Xanthomonadales bacterium]|nr:UvrD-helicase domain-containing protein [Xanthomonadales bacterium]